MRELGLTDVSIDGFPADGKTYTWTFLGAPAWEAESGTLWMLEPRAERLADFSADRIVVGRFSSSGDVTAGEVTSRLPPLPIDFQQCLLRIG